MFKLPAGGRSAVERLTRRSLKLFNNLRLFWSLFLSLIAVDWCQTPEFLSVRCLLWLVFSSGSPDLSGLLCFDPLRDPAGDQARCIFLFCGIRLDAKLFFCCFLFYNFDNSSLWCPLFLFKKSLICFFVLFKVLFFVV